MEKIKILAKGRRHFFLIEKHDLLAMFTVKHSLPYKSELKGDNKG